MWYSNRGEIHTAFRADGAFNSVMTNFNIGFCDNQTENIVLSAAEDNGHGVLERLAVNQELTAGDAYRAYMTGTYY